MHDGIVVVGAGAAGIIAAWRAACLGAPVVLLEKTKRLGTKILISGGGKCNITHDGPLEEVLKAFRPKEARFIRPSCYRFDNRQVVELLTSRGLKVYTRPDGRIFPSEGTAKDVVRILSSYLHESGVEIRLETPVWDITSVEGRIRAVQADRRISSNHVILAVGGSSYPNSGTTGDGFKWAQRLGHTVEPIRAALAPIELGMAEPKLAGVALRDCVLKARAAGKEFARWRGDLLFTHRGISGPTVLGISREVAERMEVADAMVEVDLCPDVSFEDLRHRWTMRVADSPRRQIATHLESELPDSLVPHILAAAEVRLDAIGTTFTQKERSRLIETLKGWKLGPASDVVLDKGEVVAGGVSLEEVDPKTMRSRVVEGLYLCGEVLDIAGPVGGYNLQAAFATGYVAGETAAKDWLASI